MLDLESFLVKNNIPDETWKQSGLEWQNLIDIAQDHEENKPHLTQAAEYFAKIIQGFKSVHSVRWRVKDTEHLIEKIIRKAAAGSEKYTKINKANYIEKITDLVGVRAIHLFKDEAHEIDAKIRKVWTPIETPIAYIRAGDSDEQNIVFENAGIEVKPHPAGYRSLHYVVASQPTQRKIITEIQVRTIFEEGWSEIDHRVRYPNFSDNETVEYFLNIFNRIAGNADEMGSFVKNLNARLSLMEENLKQATIEKEKSIAAMTQALQELENAKEKDAKSKSIIEKLQKNLDQFKSRSELERINNIGSVIGEIGLGMGFSPARAKEMAATLKLTPAPVFKENKPKG